MSKASYFAQILKKGQSVERYKEAGNSMLLIIKSNQPVTLDPVTNDTILEENDIVLCRVGKLLYT